MATNLYLRDQASDVNPGAATEKMLSTVRGGAATTKATSCVTGPTAGVQVTDGTAGAALEWISLSLKAVTIAGSITFNVRGFESAAQANAGFQVKVERCDSTGAVLSTIINSEFGTEMGTSESANNWSLSPTSTALSDGDRLKITVLGNDAGGTMSGSGGRNFSTVYNGPTAAASGDSFVTFTEALVQLILPSGIASAEALGTVITTPIRPSGIASAEAVGTPGIQRYIVPSAIASAEAIGDLHTGRIVKILTTPVAPDPSGTWTKKTVNIGVNVRFTQVAYGNGLWVACEQANSGSSKPSYYYTTDPSGTWTYAEVDVGATFQSTKDVFYAGGYWVIVCPSGGGSTKSIYWSTDPTSGNWTAVGPVAFDNTAVTYGNGYWVVVGGASLYYAVGDPTGTWTLVTQTPSNCTDVAYGNGYWVISNGQVGTQGIRYRATDPTGAFSGSTVFSAGDFYGGITYGNGYWLAVGNNISTQLKIAYKTGDPSGTWTENLLTGPLDGAFESVSYDASINTWVACGRDSSATISKVAYTTDPTGSWTSNNQAGKPMYGIWYDDAGIVMVGRYTTGGVDGSEIWYKLGTNIYGSIISAEAFGPPVLTVSAPSSQSLIIPSRLRGYRALIMR